MKKKELYKNIMIPKLHTFRAYFIIYTVFYVFIFPFKKIINHHLNLHSKKLMHFAPQVWSSNR